LAARNVASAAAKTGLWNVASYRLYGLDGVEKVASAVWIEAGDDETAIEIAHEKMDGHSVELWQGKRFVARIGRRQDD
jgi:hypothetical protein